MRASSMVKSAKSLLDGFSESFFIADDKMLIRYISDEALKTLGHEAEAVVGKKTCADICRSQLCNTDKCLFRSSVANKAAVVDSAIVAKANGERLPLKVRGNAILDRKGRALGFWASLSDLRSIDDNLLNNLADAAFRTDEALVIQSINEAALKTLGYSRHEVVGKMTCAELCRTPVCDTPACTIKKAMKDRGTVVATTVAKDKNDRMIPVRASCGYLADESGRVTGGFELLSAIDSIDEGFLANMADAAFRTDLNLVIQNINDAALSVLGYRREEVVGKMTCAELCRTPVCGTAECTIKACFKSGSTIVAETSARRRDGSEFPVRASCGVLFNQQGQQTGGFEILTDNSALMAMVDRLGEMADGDLAGEIDESYLARRDSIGQLATSFSDMVGHLRDIVKSIQEVGNNVSIGSQQVSSTTQQLSQGSSEQASSAEEVSASMEEMAAATKQNTDNAITTEQLSRKAAVDAIEGGKAVEDTVKAMKEIASSITIIEEIARQTNLLALNAAIEAARAGDAGKGFAVVASEVRKLAERSQKAAAQISVLSRNSVEIAENAGGLLKKIVPDIQRTSDLMQEIAAASREQSSGVDQVTQAITQLDAVIQQNSAASEELASSAEELTGQAISLQESMAFFKVAAEIETKVEPVKRRLPAIQRPSPAERPASAERRPMANPARARAIMPVMGSKSLDSDFEEF